MIDSPFAVLPGTTVRLAELPTGPTGEWEDKGRFKERFEDNLERLDELQERFYADGRHALLLVLQGMDTSGKDGTIEHVLGCVDPQGVEIHPFKVPTEEERAHDFLWRIHKAVPGKGMIGIFNRSHYEDVVVVRVKNLVPEKVWRPRYEHINGFESLLSADGVTLVKIFLHISPEEQAERLRERQMTPRKQWKFSAGDLEERKRWSLYMEAWEEALTRCSSAEAPWFVVPADKKWLRNYLVSDILVKTLDRLNLEYPPLPEGLSDQVIPEIG